MTLQLRRPVNGRAATEWVAGALAARRTERPWLPTWQRVTWWLVALGIFAAMSGTFGRGGW